MNDDIWYRGTSSHFNKWEGNSYTVHIYLNKEKSAKIYLQGEERDSEKITYVSLLILKGERGYYNEYSGYFAHESEDEILNDITRDSKYSFYCTEEITFDRVTKPVFLEDSLEKKNIISNIIEFISEDLEDAGFKKGVYKAYIRDFRRTDYRTYVVIEDDEGNTWIQQAGISDDGGIYPGKIYNLNKEDFKGLKDVAERYKEVTAKEIDITIP